MKKPKNQKTKKNVTGIKLLILALQKQEIEAMAYWFGK